jgi:hypothetical protein
MTYKSTKTGKIFIGPILSTKKSDIFLASNIDDKTGITFYTKSFLPKISEKEVYKYLEPYKLTDQEKIDFFDSITKYNKINLDNIDNI